MDIIPEDMKFTEMLRKWAEKFGYSTGGDSSFTESGFSQVTSLDGEVSEQSVMDSFRLSESSEDSNSWGDMDSLPVSPIGDRVSGRRVTPSIAAFVMQALEQQKIHSPPLPGENARDYFNCLHLAASNLSFLATRAQFGISNNRLSDSREVFFHLDEDLLSKLWTLLVCIKISFVSKKANRWSNIWRFANMWRETEDSFFQRTPSDVILERKIEKHYMTAARKTT